MKENKHQPIILPRQYIHSIFQMMSHEPILIQNDGGQIMLKTGTLNKSFECRSPQLIYEYWWNVFYPYFLTNLYYKSSLRCKHKMVSGWTNDDTWHIAIHPTSAP